MTFYRIMRRSISTMICNGFLNNCKETVTVIVQENANNPCLTIIGCVVLAKLLLHYLSRKECDRVPPSTDVMKVTKVEEQHNVTLTETSHSKRLTNHPSIVRRQFSPLENTIPIQPKPSVNGWDRERDINRLRSKYRYLPKNHAGFVNNCLQTAILQDNNTPLPSKKYRSPFDRTSSIKFIVEQQTTQRQNAWRLPPQTISSRQRAQSKPYVVLEREESNNPLLIGIGFMLFATLGIFFWHYLDNQEFDGDLLTPSGMTKVMGVEERYDPSSIKPFYIKPLTCHRTIVTQPVPTNRTESRRLGCGTRH